MSYKGFNTSRHNFNHPLKYYRIVRKVLAKQQALTEPELELLVMIDDEYFTAARFNECELTLAWDNDRIKNLIEGGWIEIYREYKPPRQARLYKPTGKAHQLVKRIYRILDGEEDLPTSARRNPIMKADDKLTYAEKILKKATLLMQEDRHKDRYG